MSENWTPAFPGQRPPFQVGNTLAEVRHGAYSDRQVLPVAKGLLADLLPTLPDYLREPRYLPAVKAYALCLARLERVATWLEVQGGEGIPEVDESGNVRGAMELLLRLEREADRHRSSLGLTPLSAARLGRDVASTQRSLLDFWADEDGAS